MSLTLGMAANEEAIAAALPSFSWGNKNLEGFGTLPGLVQLLCHSC
jgi:hypothetical protein